MKKRLIVVLGFLLILAVSGCGTQAEKDKEVGDTVQETAEEKIVTGVPAPLKEAGGTRTLSESEIESLFLKEVAEDKESKELVYDYRKADNLPKEEAKLYKARRKDASNFLSSLTIFHKNKRPLTNFYVTQGLEKILFEKVDSEYIAYAKGVELVATPKDGGGKAVYSKDGNLYLLGTLGDGVKGSVLLVENVGKIKDLKFSGNYVYYLTEYGELKTTIISPDSYFNQGSEEKVELVDVLKTRKTNPVKEVGVKAGIDSFTHGGLLTLSNNRLESYGLTFKDRVAEISEPIESVKDEEDYSINVLVKDVGDYGELTYYKYDLRGRSLGSLYLWNTQKPLFEGGFYKEDGLRERDIPTFIYTGTKKYEETENTGVTYYRVGDTFKYGPEEEFQKGDITFIAIKPKVDDIYNILYDEQGNPEVVFYSNGNDFESVNLKTGDRARKNSETGEFHKVKSKVRKVNTKNPIDNSPVEVEIVE